MVTNKISELNDKQAEIDAILENLTYKKVDAYIENNVTDLATAKGFLKKLSKVVLYLGKKQS